MLLSVLIVGFLVLLLLVSEVILESRFVFETVTLFMLELPDCNVCVLLTRLELAPVGGNGKLVILEAGKPLPVVGKEATVLPMLGAGKLTSVTDEEAKEPKGVPKLGLDAMTFEA